MSHQGMRDFLGALGSWFKATGDWEEHAKACSSCCRDVPHGRCGTGLSFYERMMLTYQTMKKTDMVMVAEELE